MDTFEYMYVMDYYDGTITEIKLSPEDKDVNSDVLLSKYGFNESTCSWMFTTRKINNVI